ncbi:MAG: primosomal protein N' [Gammaproteobacteria bacterium]|nr:MAG: primosomal protein N' [Gammaproteobacteria bacterium]
MPQVLRVALDTPLRRLFDYLPPAEAGAGPLPAIGARVRVPFGRQRLIGLVLAAADTSEVPQERLKPILEVLDARPVLDSAAIELLTWAAQYYHHPIGEVLTGALPRPLRFGAAAVEVEERWLATDAGARAGADGEPRRAPKQRLLLTFLIENGAAPAGILDERLGSWREAARALLARGLIASAAIRIETPPSPDARLRAAGPVLLPEQSAAIEAVASGFGRFGAYVLHGITGSGKTEVYLRLIERVLAQGRRALVLVPEIGLTPQLLGRFRERFDAPLAVLHSALSDSERLGGWREASSGRARIVLGTRSVVFAPVPDLGLVVVDEEHDASYKQHEGGFHYSARDLAVVRARHAGAPVVLGSATPSLETLHNVAAGRYVRLTLPRRAAEAQPPRLALLDLRTSAVRSGIATPAVLAIERHLGDDGQVLVFLNRRGYAPTLLCTACGWIAPCRDCDARLTVHLAAGRLRCHHCGADAPLPARCTQCGFAVKPVGQGTERIEETLAALFPGVRIARLDRDVVRRRGELEEVMRRMSSGEARILVGTQMVTKSLLAEGYDGFARAALEERAQAAWPPFSRLAAVRDSATTAQAALGFLTDARSIARRAPRGVRLLGPVPAAMAKRAGRFHAQLLIESAERARLHEFLDAWLPEVEALRSARRVRWSLDVDPIELF